MPAEDTRVLEVHIRVHDRIDEVAQGAVDLGEVGDDGVAVGGKGEFFQTGAFDQGGVTDGKQRIDAEGFLV